MKKLRSILKLIFAKEFILCIDNHFHSKCSVDYKYDVLKVVLEETKEHEQENANINLAKQILSN